MSTLRAVVVDGVVVGDIDHKGIGCLSTRRGYISRVEAAVKRKARAVKRALDDGVVLGFR